MTEDDEIVQVFLEESRENLDQLDLDLVELETRPQDPELLGRVFRAIHTIKGTCGFLGFQRLETLSHAGEDLLGALRAGDLVLDASITTSLLEFADAIRAVLDQVSADGKEGEDDHEAVIADLKRYLPSKETEPEPAATAVKPKPRTTKPRSTKPRASAAPNPKPATPAKTERKSDPDVDASPEPAAASPSSTTVNGAEKTTVKTQTPDATVRVDVAVLDKLQDLVGELTLTRSQFGDAAEAEGTGSLAQAYLQLRLLTRELQDSVMTARMQPIRIVLGKTHRIVRNLATTLNKSVLLEVTGEDVGVDRSIIEALRDPITHLVRNAIDHGIETPGERIRLGKPAEATLRIDASLEAGRVQIDVSDNGRGIDTEGIVERAVAVGMLTAEQGGALTDVERLELMFRPGLSTREEATTTSGRGVGMDIVRANLDHIGGSVDVWTEPGIGSRFRLNVPLTLAIIPAVTVTSRDERYAIPQSDVHTVLHLDAEQAAAAVDDLNGAWTHRWYGHLLPLVDLAHVLGGATAPQHTSGTDDGMRIVVVQGHGRTFGLVVDEVGDNMEAVVKPLPNVLRSLHVFGGVTILPDGSPAVILDISGIGVQAGVPVSSLEDVDTSPVFEPAAALLLATGDSNEPVAFSLGIVHRLEQFKSGGVESSDAIDLVQYGDLILPLVPVTADRGGRAVPETITTVVCETSAGLVGMTVASVDEIAPRPETPIQPATRRGVSARLVLDDRVTELLDVEMLISDAGIAGPG